MRDRILHPNSCNEPACPADKVGEYEYCVIHNALDALAEYIWERYLTETEKAARLMKWEQRKNSGKSCTDVDLYPCVDSLNLISGLVVIHACAGHAGDQGKWNMGYMWIRLDKALNQLFRLYAFRLSASYEICSTAMNYDPTDGEVAVVNFVGAEMGKLPSSLQAIHSFFQAIGDKARVWRNSEGRPAPIAGWTNPEK